MREHRVASGGEAFSKGLPGRQEGGRQPRTPGDDSGKRSRRLPHAPFEILSVEGGRLRGALPIERIDRPEEVADEAAGAPVRLGCFAPCLVEPGRLGPKEPQAPPEKPEQRGDGKTGGLQDPRVEGNPEERRPLRALRFELGKELHHPRAALGEVSDLSRHGFDRPGRSQDHVQLFPGGIESRVDDRELRVQGRGATGLRGGNGAQPGDLGGQKALHAGMDVQQCPHPGETRRVRRRVCYRVRHRVRHRVRQPGPVDLSRELPGGDDQRIRTSGRDEISSGENVREPVRGLPEVARPAAECFETGPEHEDPRPFGFDGVESRGEPPPLGLEIGDRSGGNACEELQRTGAKGGHDGGGRNRSRGEVLRQRRGRGRDASLLIGERMAPVDLRAVIEANERNGGEDGNCAEEQEPAQECEELASRTRTRGISRGRLTARGNGRRGFGHARNFATASREMNRRPVSARRDDDSIRAAGDRDRRPMEAGRPAPVTPRVPKGVPCVKSRIAKWTAATSVAAMVTLGAGCASTDDLNALRADVDSLKGAAAAAQDTAAGAQDTASGAVSDAEAARAEAGQASRTANRALSAAREAQACCAANSEKIERMFKKSMMK